MPVFAYLALAVLIVETAVLFAWLRRRRGSLAISIALNGASGICLIAALLTALHGGTPPIFAAWLAGALVAHLVDLHLRLRQN